MTQYKMRKYVTDILKTVWKRLRYKEYEMAKYISPVLGDNAPRIQKALDDTSTAPALDYEAAWSRYSRSKFKFLRRKPILSRTVYLASGTFEIRDTLLAPKNVGLQGIGPERTNLER